MKVLLDTNIVLDVLLERGPWLDEAKQIWRASDERRIIGYVTATTLTNVFYVARRLVGQTLAREAVRTCLEAFEICPVDGSTLEQAYALPGQDFEDNLQIACAALGGLDAVVTRNVDDFQGSTVAIFTPAELITHLG